ncbi:MAG: hypothetical protein FWE09_04965, partial [Treponema sp.]|nr:hypothetical protein [Treponema sp.]
MLCLALNAHFPFSRAYSAPSGKDASSRSRRAEAPSLAPESAQEDLFFEAVSETYLPLLEMFDRLAAAGIPFRMALSISPILGQMLGDRHFASKCAARMDRRIAFGERAASGRGREAELARIFLDREIDARAAFSSRYSGGILGALAHHARRGRVEIVGACATGAFLPFFRSFPEALRAQLEVGLAFDKNDLGAFPSGFWLPGLGWAEGLDSFLLEYGLEYAIVDARGFVFGNPPPSRG